MRETGRCARAIWLDALLIALAAVLFMWALVTPLSAIAAIAPTAQQQALSADEQALLAAYQSGELVRLHILADSDQAESQRVKLRVRDALIAAFGQTLAQSGAQGADAAYQALLDNAEHMREVAEECARAEGFAGDVRAEVGLLALPEKRYGRVTLPQGEYRALRVTLGSGEGQNWWCVLFPRLCLALAGEDENEDEAERDESAPTLAWDSLRIWRAWTACPV